MILGVDIGGTKTAVVLGTRTGEILWRKQFATAPLRGFKPVYDELLKTAHEALNTAEKLGLPEAIVDCIGVSIGGPMDSLTGIIKSPPNLPHWDNIPLKDLLAKEFSLPVFVEHDGNTGALAEWYFGAGKGCRNLVFITMGTGFGAGLILDGKLYRGTSNTAGEIGHIRIAEDGPKCFGKAGSLEGYGSGTGMAMLAQTMYPLRYGRDVTVKELYADFTNNSEEAAAVFQRAGTSVGRGLAMIADMINPECIILGGLGMRIGDAINPPLLTAFNQEALKESAEACRIVPAQLGESIGDIAALAAAIYQSTTEP
jgi:glucokinase